MSKPSRLFAALLLGTACAAAGLAQGAQTQFGGAGEPARQIRYRAKVTADAPEEVVRELIEHTDRVAEVHNTLRGGIAVDLMADGQASGA